MASKQARTSDARLCKYLDQLASVIGRVSREGPLRDYCTGLLLPSMRKSVEPIAAMTAPDRVSAQHQSLLHFVNQGTWSDEEVLAKVREMVLPAMQRHEAVLAWVIDDTGFPKHGKHSVGVSHQYCGQSGKQDNCQVAVSLSLANHHASLPVAYRLYLPKGWADDQARRTKAGVPDEITFKTKNEIAREQIEWACEAGLPRGVALMDVSYGKDASLRRRMTRSSACSTQLPSAATRKSWRKARRRRPPNSPARCQSARGRRSPGGKVRASRSHRVSLACASDHAVKAAARTSPTSGC